MINNIWHIGSFLLAAGLLAGCSADPLDDEGLLPQEIKVQVGSAPSTDATRASIINDDTDLQTKDIRIETYYHGTTTPHISEAKLHYGSSSWGFVNGSGDAISYFWPIEGSVLAPSGTGTSLDFVGYAPYTAPSYIGNISYSVANGLSFQCTTLPVTSAGQASLDEFMYAIVPNQTLSSDNGAPKAGSNVGKVALDLQHPFSKISLQLKTSHRAIYNLKSITFKGIKNNGTFTHGDSPQWVLSGSNTNLEITLNQGISQDADFTSAQVSSMRLPLIVLPQSLSTAGQIEVKLTWNSGDSESTYTFDNPVSNWESGKSYNYTLDLLGEIKFTVSVEAWVTESTRRNLRF